MTFDELRAQIEAEMPPGWCWRLSLYGVKPAGYTLAVWANPLNVEGIFAPTPEALLAAWRELKGRLA